MKKRITETFLCMAGIATLTIAIFGGAQTAQAASAESEDENTQEQTLSEEKEKIALLTGVLGMPVNDGALDLDSETEDYFHAADLFGYYGSISVQYEHSEVNAVGWISVGEYGVSSEYYDIIDNLTEIYGEYTFVGNYDDILSDTYVWISDVYDCDMVACGIDAEDGTDQIAIYWFNNSNSRDFESVIDRLVLLPENSHISRSDMGEFTYNDDVVPGCMIFYEDGNNSNDESIFYVVYEIDSDNVMSISLIPYHLDEETGISDLLNVAMFLNMAVDSSLSSNDSYILALNVFQGGSGGSDVKNDIEYEYLPDSAAYKISYQYNLEEDNDTATYQAYETAVNLTMDDLTKTSSGSYAYDGLVISDSELSSIEDGTLYMAMAQQLEGFYIFTDETYSMWGSTVVPIVWGFEKPDKWDDLKPYVDETKKLIARTQSLGNLMSMFESLSVTEGTFDYVEGEFSFEIKDLTKAAEELGITETALGYILAYINEYGSTTTFNGNSCTSEVKWYGPERTADSSIYTVYEDFSLVDIKERMVSGDYDFFYYRTDNGITEDDYFDVCSQEGIRLGESSDAVIFEYGGELLPYDKSNDIIYYSDLEWDDPTTKPEFDDYKYYIVYTVEGYGDVVFYFKEDKLLYMIDFCNDIFY